MTTTPPTPAPPEAAPADPVPDEHQADGLDLARAAARAAAASPAHRRPTPEDALLPTTYDHHVSRRPPRRPRPPAARAGHGSPDRQPRVGARPQGAGVFGRWTELVGDEVASHCTPESFDDGRLVVRTDSTAWATQLKLLAPTVVRRLNEELGHGTVTVIEVLGPHLPSWTKGRLSSRDGRGPRDTYG